MVFEDIYDAKNAQEHLTGYNVHNRYIHVLFYNMQREIKKKSLEQVRVRAGRRCSGRPRLRLRLARLSSLLGLRAQEEAELRKLQEKYGVDGQQHPTAAAAAKK